MSNNTAERFAIVLAELLNTDISNDDPMRYSKRSLTQAARQALDDGINRAAQLLDVRRAIEHDQAEIKKGGG